MREGVVCGTCRAEGHPSVVFYRGTRSTLMGGDAVFWVDGVEHRHDPNTHTDMYECKRGHRWEVRRVPKCPQGDYP